MGTSDDDISDINLPVAPAAPIIVFNGAYGSGKTEVAVNFAMSLRRAGHETTIADLDIANPYFRSREAVDILERNGVRTVFPKGEFSMSDLPIMLPEMAGMIARPRGYSVLDVGGDDVGSRVLRYFANELGKNAFELLMVVNANRPFTRDVAGILKMRQELEAAAGCRVNGFVANTHLVDQTVGTTISEGYPVVREAAQAAGIPVRFVTVMRGLRDDVDWTDIDVPVFVMERLMVPPHVRRIKKSPLYEL